MDELAQMTIVIINFQCSYVYIIYIKNKVNLWNKTYKYVHYKVRTKKKNLCIYTTSCNLSCMFCKKKKKIAMFLTFTSEKLCEYFWMHIKENLLLNNVFILR